MIVIAVKGDFWNCDRIYKSFGCIINFAIICILMISGFWIVFGSVILISAAGIFSC